jgi:hypothetical protein
MDTIGLRSDGNTPLAVFHELVVDPQRTGGALMFRLAEAPGTILVANSIINKLKESAPAGGWNLTAYPVADS